MHSPSVSHRNVVDRILRYLKSAPGNGLMFYKNGNIEVIGYTDVDWAGSITDRPSTSGYFTFVGVARPTPQPFSRSSDPSQAHGPSGRPVPACSTA
ncbi:hypothetical protein L3X38_038047 [Prunus dulcis]|uniref:Uncharacterized protein n=1 Tax=Prunus dulcis TaxID=3755 RepID=A0AAD4YR99_PRUDU|nr:hypothetical protein L3X38_038047 [Prunus dulcis]